MNNAERIVDLVSDAAGHHAQRGETRRSDGLYPRSFQIFLELLACGDIPNRHQHLDFATRPQRADCDFHRKFASVFAAPRQFRPLADEPDERKALVIGPIAPVQLTEIDWDKGFQGTAEKLLACVPK